MSRRDGACWRHPAQRAAGVCADCLKERLSALSPSAETPHRSSYSDRTSAFGFVVVDRKKFCAASSGGANAGGSGDYGLARGGQQQLVSPLQLSDAYLRRSKSWSHWEGSSGEVGLATAAAAYARNQCGGFAARKSDAAVLDDWTRQRFFSIFAKDQQQKRKDAPFGGSNSRSTPQHLRYDYFTKSASRNAASSWLQATPSKVDQNFSSNNNNNNTSTSGTILENGGLEEQAFDSAAAAAAAKKSPRKASSSSAWWSSLLQQLAFRKPKSKAEAAAALDKKKSTKSGGGSSSSSSLTGFFNRTGTRKKEENVKKTSSWTTGKHGFKSDFVNWRHPPKQQAVESLSWISSPLRLFKHGGGGGGGNKRSNLRNGSAAGAADEHHQHHKQQCERLSCSDERSSWSIPSPTEMKRLNHQTATTPASYTAYYRDYGAWSLSSSPVPNNRWGNVNGSRGKQQPWESRDIPHPSSSPYHRAVGSSTWNFYLTPLRPVKGSTGSSKHRY